MRVYAIPQGEGVELENGEKERRVGEPGEGGRMTGKPRRPTHNPGPSFLKWLHYPGQRLPGWILQEQKQTVFVFCDTTEIQENNKSINLRTWTF